MKSCDYCNKKYTDSIIEIIKCVNKTHILCPNCRAIHIQNSSFELEEAIDLDDDILGTPGAVVFTSGDEEYYLKKDTMLRLLSHSLLPEEYKALKKDCFQYMLHCDFYTKDGIALQPLKK